MKFSLTSALAGGGAALTAGALLLGTLVGGEVEVLDRTTDLIAGSPAVESPVCPRDYNQLQLSAGPATADASGRTIVVLCERGTFKLRGFEGGGWERFDTATGNTSDTP